MITPTIKSLNAPHLRRIKKFPIRMLSLLFVYAALASSAQADVLVAYPFTGNSDAPTSVADGITATSFTAGSGLAAGAIGFSTAAVENSGEADATVPVRFIRGTTTTTTEAGAISGNDYFSFTLTPGGTDLLNLDSLFFDYSGNTLSAGTMSTSFFIQSSVDNFTSIVGSTATVDTTGTGSTPRPFQRHTLNLSGTSFQNLDEVTFRLYIYQSDDNSNTLARLDNVTVSGTVIPEPGTYALIAGSLALVAIMVRRRRD